MRCAVCNKRWSISEASLAAADLLDAAGGAPVSRVRYSATTQATSKTATDNASGFFKPFMYSYKITGALARGRESGTEPAIHDIGRSGDEGGIVARQKYRDAGHFFGAPDTPKSMQPAGGCARG